MKPQNNLFKTGILLFAIILIIGCSKDDTTDPKNIEKLIESEGINTDELETYSGDLGLSFSAREIVKKGHNPTKVIITIDADTGDFNKTLSIDQDTNLAQLSFKAEDLSEEAQKQLKAGVPVSIEILDDNEAVLASKDFSVLSFKSNPTAQEVDNNTLSDVRDNLAFKEDVPYYFQIVKEGENTSNAAMFVNYDYDISPTFSVPINLRNEYFNKEVEFDKKKYQFTIKRILDDPEYFAIITEVDDNDKHLFLRIVDAYLFQDNSRHVEDTDINTLPIENRFKFLRDASTGFYTIIPKAKGPLRKRIVDNRTRLIATSDEDYELAYFRILTLDIDWEIETLETKNLQPILPAASNADSFESNTTLSNCTDGLLTQTFNIEINESKTSSVAVEESFSMTSSESSSISSTIGVEAGASFYGVGVTISAETTATNEVETSITNTNTQFTGEDTTTSQTVSTERTIEVNPGEATLVYDTFQKYNNILIPFIQRYRVKGSYQNGAGDLSLSGNEIFTQFLFTNANGGLVTKIGTDFIELTVRGVNTIDNVIQTISKADSVEPNCN